MLTSALKLFINVIYVLENYLFSSITMNLLVFALWCFTVICSYLCSLFITSDATLSTSEGNGQLCHLYIHGGNVTDISFLQKMLPVELKSKLSLIFCMCVYLSVCH